MVFRYGNEFEACAATRKSPEDNMYHSSWAWALDSPFKSSLEKDPAGQTTWISDSGDFRGFQVIPWAFLGFQVFFWEFMEFYGI